MVLVGDRVGAGGARARVRRKRGLLLCSVAVTTLLGLRSWSWRLAGVGLLLVMWQSPGAHGCASVLVSLFFLECGPWLGLSQAGGVGATSLRRPHPFPSVCRAGGSRPGWLCSGANVRLCAGTRGLPCSPLSWSEAGLGFGPALFPTSLPTLVGSGSLRLSGEECWGRRAGAAAWSRLGCVLGWS